MAVVMAPAGADRVIAASVRASVREADAVAAPFPHWRLSGVLPEPLARELAGLPFGPPDLGGISGRRELHNDQRRYLAGPMLGAQPLAGALARAFQAWPVVAAFAAMTGAMLAGAFLRIEYALDTEGFWLEPHTDLGVKLFTLFLQLGEPGQEALGTDLYWGPGRWACRLPFGWNAALVFVPAGDTWHGFEPRPIAGLRRSLIVNYVTYAWRERDQLAFPDQPVGPTEKG